MATRIGFRSLWNICVLFVVFVATEPEHINVNRRAVQPHQLDSIQPRTASVAAKQCACLEGTVPANVVSSITFSNHAFVVMADMMRYVYNLQTPCVQNLYRETFILSASFEGSHEALGRYTRANSTLDNYFVVPTWCGVDAGSGCIDHRCDWAKNALLDTFVLMFAAQTAVDLGHSDPTDWLNTEEWLGNLQEYAVDATNNDKVWTYCPTSYNPVAWWHTETNNMTVLPQMLWDVLPKFFVEIAIKCNCTMPRPSPKQSPRLSPPQQHVFQQSSTTKSNNSNDGLNCSASATRVSDWFGMHVFATNEVVETLQHTASPKVLAAFESTPSKNDTMAGLLKMLTQANTTNFRTSIGSIWDDLMKKPI
eukprot:m.214574 g.214574  ORF g.214574 m.214574 type:complete len:365 (-) comp33176_c6_seq23:73-1167(-)